MSRIMHSIVAGIALTLALGATAAAARPLHRAAGKDPAPVGIAEKVWSWWNDLAARWTPQDRGGLSALSGREGSQMDPNGVANVAGQRPPAPSKTPGL